MAELVNHLAGMTCDKYQDALNENNIYEMIKDMRGLESLQCCFADQLCLHQLREKSTGLLSAPPRRQPRTDARRPGIGRNCAQIMPRTALGHAEQREERWDWWKPNHAKSVFRSLLHFSAALYLVTSCAE